MARKQKHRSTRRPRRMHRRHGKLTKRDQTRLRRRHLRTVKRMHSETYLTVEYRPTATLGDREINKVVGRYSGASGYAFASGMRDMEWTFKSKVSAAAAGRRLKQKFGHKVKVKITCGGERADDYKSFFKLS